MVKTELIPVIHMVTKQQVFENVKTCIDCGIKKIFLINHAVSSSELIKCGLDVMSIYPNLWVGINLLGVPTRTCIGVELTFDGLWCDSSISTKEAAEHRKFNGIFFGGLAFKYQPQPKDLQKACEDAIITTDVATTSGIGTGIPANIEKIKMIRQFLGDHPMAIASGVSAENVDNYKGIADYLLVATSITDRNEMIIKDKLIELKNKL
jgi:hypothetical protein